MLSNNFHLQPLVLNCNEVEAWANNYENKDSLWTYFKNYFTWLTGMKKLIFDYSNFFGSGHFSLHPIWQSKRGQKRTEAKMSKVSIITLFMLVDLMNKFWNMFCIYRLLCQGFYLITIWHIWLQKKIVWPHQFLLTWAT